MPDGVFITKVLSGECFRKDHIIRLTQNALRIPSSQWVGEKSKEISICEEDMFFKELFVFVFDQTGFQAGTAGMNFPFKVSFQRSRIGSGGDANFKWTSVHLSGSEHAVYFMVVLMKSVVFQLTGDIEIQEKHAQKANGESRNINDSIHSLFAQIADGQKWVKDEHGMLA
ncbi:hypothetical protein MARINOS108_10813 [Marinoscillum sp. 108]|nr:hypothetical protein MARINOS108_10813 [Marinoscillum sp. 108]